ncbi:hypothetical protein A3A93_05285 [Candidatus Roizmanbacteria bacterium RIFCSPLOWO2_01_FULL_38_12]|uniref:Four helix bundle protein n=1 Tax=Candidatus Roizmanbacteria bacterium RIFCSPLOWO2_01_FULL_38_12 TaxID=1802061 RepID=A0A1F7IZ95_9BACT|nr:MAG: hypothetical protein A2861_03500 [Candidatus Roizmanbacteria bacterium RIFCSPHIGHO2_01_FULL_38_15]OGK35666.1 MAG: hypothetical protein A3F59_01715 [Candidatus Roizmanbacteria bacterium RIFCSPHIGHO2_12_FULL_38_13]OGK48655.1 MAG: hypothetical protein A3A93_05285 [Candidatus Roizmanbacteria bacterium RIFCSPLOWO2_01_FULL_38_12]
MKSFTDLIVWKESHRLTIEIYKATEKFPSNEIFGITNQIRRAAVSIPSNIAEGFGRITTKDKKQFYIIARGSLIELQSQLLICRDLGYLNNKAFNELATLTNNIHRLINGFIKSTVENKYVANK